MMMFSKATVVTLLLVACSRTALCEIPLSAASGSADGNSAVGNVTFGSKIATSTSDNAGVPMEGGKPHNNADATSSSMGLRVARRTASDADTSLRKGEPMEVSNEESDPKSGRSERRDLVLQARIVGGEQAVPQEFPFYIQWHGFFMGTCGASLIHSDVMLTAAHCGLGSNDVWVGAYEWTTEGYGAEKRRIVQRSPHPQFQLDSFSYDFAVMKLDAPVTTIAPVPLNSDRASPGDGEILTVVGLGSITTDGSSRAQFLRKVEVPKVPDAKCNFQLSGAGGINPNLMFCAGRDEGGVDSCQQDSGGPIISMATGSPVQVGVVSWGIGCAQRYSPGVYARISDQYDWIQQQICVLSANPPASCNGGGTDDPTASPSAERSNEPSPVPSSSPSGKPTASDPTVLPSSGPSFFPSYEPSSRPSSDLTPVPSNGGGSDPAVLPSTQPSRVPSLSSEPSLEPSSSPSGPGTISPSRTSPPAQDEGGCVELKVEITTDTYGEDTSFVVYDENGTSVLQGDNFVGLATDEFITCVDPSACYNLVVSDSFRDGMCCDYGQGGYRAYLGDAEVASGGVFFTPTDERTIGSCGGDLVSTLLVIDMQTDNYPEESSFFVRDLRTNQKIFRRERGDLLQNTTYDFRVNIDPNLCYELAIADWYGDGICCIEGNGFLRARVGEVVVAEFAEFEFYEEVSFGNSCGDYS